MADARVKVILDTSIYIPLINKGITYAALEVDIGKPLIYLSATVVAELYAGAFDRKTIKLLDKFYKVFCDAKRVITPSASDWQAAGSIIAKLGKKYGFEDKYLSGLQNDLLISLSARQIGAIVITNNTKDFLRIKEFVNFKLSI